MLPSDPIICICSAIKSSIDESCGHNIYRKLEQYDFVRWRLRRLDFTDQSEPPINGKSKELAGLIAGLGSGDRSGKQPAVAGLPERQQRDEIVSATRQESRRCRTAGAVRHRRREFSSWEIGACVHAKEDGEGRGSEKKSSGKPKMPSGIAMRGRKRGYWIRFLEHLQKLLYIW